MMPQDGPTSSPEVEFGTFLRLPHESRTFSRPADSYGPPSRPTSPPPASSPSHSPATVFLHGRPAPVVSKMRQGAPRLGGLGLGGIVEPTPAAPPPLPARRPQQQQQSTLPAPAVPAAPKAASHSVETTSSNPSRPQTCNPSSELDPARTAGVTGGANLPQRPFLSPEMEKPVAREGAFALDRPKVPDVLEGADVRRNGALTSDANTAIPHGTCTVVSREAVHEEEDAASPEAFPSPEVGDEENGISFDRFTSALGSHHDDGDENHAFERKTTAAEATDQLDEGDRASVDSTGDSSFATPETLASPGQEEEEAESIPDLALDDSVDARGPGEEEVEEITFGGPGPDEADDNTDGAAFEHDSPGLDLSSTAGADDGDLEPRSLSHALVSRADKSMPSDAPLHSPDVSIAPSDEVESIGGSEGGFRLEKDADTEEEANESQNKSLQSAPGKLAATSFGSVASTSPTYSYGSSLPDDASSPSYSQGLRNLSRDPASDYPSPPSSPATSVPGSIPLEEEGHVEDGDDVSVYGASVADKETGARDTEFIEETPDTLNNDDHPSATESNHDGPPEFASSTPDVEPPRNLASKPISDSAANAKASPYFDRDRRTSAGSRRSRFSYQGLGLRMPSSIAPRALTNDGDEGDGGADEPVPRVDNPSSSASPTERSTFQGNDAVPSEAMPSRSRPPTESEASAFDPSLLPTVEPATTHLTTTLSHEVEASSHDAETHDSVAGYRDEVSSGASSASAYAPSSIASTPEIVQAYHVPVSTARAEPIVSPLPSAADVGAFAPVFAGPTDHVASERSEGVTRERAMPMPATPDSRFERAVENAVDIGQHETSHESSIETRRQQDGEEDPNQLSTVGVAVDVGTAIAGALVMGGLAVGQSAWRGLAVGWSAWRGANNQLVMQEAKVLEVSNVPAESASTPTDEERDEFKSYVREPEMGHVKGDDEVGRKAESSVISTEWGEAEFDAPEGFLEEFKIAMAEIGEEDLAANEQAQIDAQLAAYQSASRQHADAVASSPSMSDRSSLASDASPTTAFRALPNPRSTRSREPSALRPQTETILEDSADEDERELEDLLAPVWDSPSRLSRIAVEFPTRHGFAPPPGLAGSFASGSRPTSVMSTSSVASSAAGSSPKLNPSSSSTTTTASPRPPAAKLSKTSRGILGFGRSKSTKNVAASAKPASRLAPSPSLPGLSGAKSAQSVLSHESAKTARDSSSQHSKSSSHKTAGRRSSIFNFGGGAKDAPPVPSIESQIKDTTYISYGSSKRPQRRDSNASSISTGLYASRDPYLIAPTAGTSPAPAATSASSPTAPRARERTSSSSVLSASAPSEVSRREHDLGGAPLGRRRSSLRATSAYDNENDKGRDGGGGGAPLKRSTSIVERDKKLYRVRFGNAVGGIGLRSVADDEAVRAGGDRYGQRWVGVGRGRYGNMIIKTDEESDMVYAEQVAQIKKKWRAFGSEQSRDWAAVQID